MSENQKKNITDINVGMKIELDIEHGNQFGIHKKTTLYSVVEEICKDGGLLIHTPVYQRNQYRLPDDTVILVRFSVGTLVYAVPVMYAGCVEIGNALYEKLLPIGEIHQNQRISYRLPLTLPVTVERFNMNNYNQPLIGKTINISDGGMAFSGQRGYWNKRKNHGFF